MARIVNEVRDAVIAKLGIVEVKKEEKAKKTTKKVEKVFGNINSKKKK